MVGGAGLLGRRFSAAIAEAGGTAVVVDRDLEAAETVCSEIGGNAWAIAADITDPRAVRSLIEAIAAKSGRINAVVNTAYPRNENYGRRFEDVEYGDFCQNLSLNLGSYFLVAQQFALYFRENGGGNIVNLGSIYGSMTPRFEVYADTHMTMPVEYAAIKSGVIHLTRYMAQYFKKDGIRVNTLSPGGIRDNQSASFLEHYDAHGGLKGMLDPEDITGTLLYLLSDASRHVTGQNLIVDDGFSL